MVLRMRTAVQPCCFKIARSRCSLPTSALPRRTASASMVARISFAEFVYLSLSAVIIPPGSSWFLRMSTISVTFTPFNVRTWYGAVSSVDTSANSKCSLPTKFWFSFFDIFAACLRTFSSMALYGSFNLLHLKLLFVNGLADVVSHIFILERNPLGGLICICSCSK